MPRPKGAAAEAGDASGASDASDAEPEPGLADEFDDYDPTDAPLDAAAENAEGAESDDPDRPDDQDEFRPQAGPGDRQAARAVDSRQIIIVPPREAQSSNMMTQAEVARAISLRAQQISDHARPFTDAGSLDDAEALARKEFYDRRSPLILRRKMGQTERGEWIVETWTVREMAFPAEG